MKILLVADQYYPPTLGGSAISSRRLVRLAITTATDEGIPYQLAVRRGGATDARALQFARTGVPCVVLGTPARYIHSHQSIIRLDDYLGCFALARALVRRLDAATVAGLTRWEGVPDFDGSPDAGRKN